MEIRGEMFDDLFHEYYYIDEYMGFRLGDLVEPKRRTTKFRRGELVIIVKVKSRPENNYSYVAIVRDATRNGDSGYAREFANMNGLDRTFYKGTFPIGIESLRKVYVSPCDKCVNACKGDDICTFYEAG